MRKRVREQTRNIIDWLFKIKKDKANGKTRAKTHTKKNCGKGEKVGQQGGGEQGKKKGKTTSVNNSEAMRPNREGEEK